jgi:Competence protein CoiA-like family
MFVALLINERDRTEAKLASKALKYICPRCEKAVILAQGKVRRHYFRHEANSACPFGAPESWQHQEAKAVILGGVRARGLEAFPEVEVLSIEGDRRADVLAWAPSENSALSADLRRLAFEVQHTAISIEELSNRTTAYLTAAVPVIWIPVIDAKKFEHSRIVKGTNLFCVSEYSTPDWVREMYRHHGHLWIYVPQTNAFWRGWLLPSYRWRDGKEWYSPEGEYNSTSGYWNQLANKRDFFVEGPFPFADLRIVRVNRTAQKCLGLEGRRKFLVDLLPPGEGKNEPQRVRSDRVESATDADATWHRYEASVRIDNEWELAKFGPLEGLPSL